VREIVKTETAGLYATKFTGLDSRACAQAAVAALTLRFKSQLPIPLVASDALDLQRNVSIVSAARCWVVREDENF
jgi:hypothetical protein